MPKIVNHSERRAGIARAAAACIAELGLEGATMREIARCSGFSKGIVEHYFTNKDEVIAAALEQMNLRYLAREREATASLHGLRALRARMHCVLPLSEESRQEWKIRLCFWSLAALNPAAGGAQRQRLALTRARYQNDLEQACALGELTPPADLEQTAAELGLFMAGAACGALLDPEYYPASHLRALIERTLHRLSEGTYT